MENEVNSRLKRFLKSQGITQKAFCETVGLSINTLKTTFQRGSDIDLEVLSNMASKYPVLNLEWLLTGVEPMLVSEMPVQNYDFKGSPYFNVDFIGGFDLVLEDKMVNPEYYIDLPPYNKPDILWCNLYGKSMEPFIMSGDRIAIKEIPIEDVIYGKAYGIITNAGLRTVKYIVRSTQKGCYRLVPENKDPKFGDYQDIPIKDIFKIFVLMGAVRAF